MATTTADGFLIEPDSPATFAWFATEVAPLVAHHHPGVTLARPLRPRPPREPVRVVKQIHLAAHFPGVNNTTVWSDPDSGSQTDFSSFVHLAQTAERGKFDFFFLAEGLRLREHRGRIFDLDVVGRPDSLTVLAALAAVTDRIGLAATLNTTFNEPYELARQFATLDHLSNGRAAWNAVTSPDAFTGENFRRAGFLASRRPLRARRGVHRGRPASCGTRTATAASSSTTATSSTSRARSTCRAARRATRS